MSDQKAYKPYPDFGSLRATQFKKGPKSPDYWGNIAINLKDLTGIQNEDGLTIVKLSGWKKVDKAGKTYLSIAVDRFVPNADGGREQSAPARSQQEDDDSDIPF